MNTSGFQHIGQKRPAPPDSSSSVSSSESDLRPPYKRSRTSGLAPTALLTFFNEPTPRFINEEVDPSPAHKADEEGDVVVGVFTKNGWCLVKRLGELVTVGTPLKIQIGENYLAKCEELGKSPYEYGVASEQDYLNWAEVFAKESVKRNQVELQRLKDAKDKLEKRKKKKGHKKRKSDKVDLETADARIGYLEGLDLDKERNKPKPTQDVWVQGVVIHVDSYITVQYWLNGWVFQYDGVFHDDPRVKLTPLHKDMIIRSLTTERPPETSTGATRENRFCFVDLRNGQATKLFIKNINPIRNYTIFAPGILDYDFDRGLGCEERYYERNMSKLEKVKDEKEYLEMCDRAECLICHQWVGFYEFEGKRKREVKMHPIFDTFVVCNGCFDEYQYCLKTSNWQEMCAVCSHNQKFPEIYCSNDGCEYRYCDRCMALILGRERYDLTFDDEKHWDCIKCDPSQLENVEFDHLFASKYTDVDPRILYDATIRGLFMDKPGMRAHRFPDPNEYLKYGVTKVSGADQVDYDGSNPLHMISTVLFLSYEYLFDAENGVWPYIEGIYQNVRTLDELRSKNKKFKHFFYRIYYDQKLSEHPITSELLEFLKLHPRVELYEYSFDEFRRYEDGLSEGLFGTLIRLLPFNEEFLEENDKSFVAIRDADSILTSADLEALIKWNNRRKKSKDDKTKYFHRYYCGHYDNPFWFGTPEINDKRYENMLAELASSPPVPPFSPDTYGGWPFLCGAMACKQRIKEISLMILEFGTNVMRDIDFQYRSVRFHDKLNKTKTFFSYTIDQQFLEHCIYQGLLGRDDRYIETVNICIPLSVGKPDKITVASEDPSQSLCLFFDIPEKYHKEKRSTKLFEDYFDGFEHDWTEKFRDMGHVAQYTYEEDLKERRAKAVAKKMRKTLTKYNFPDK